MRISTSNFVMGTFAVLFFLVIHLSAADATFNGTEPGIEINVLSSSSNSTIIELRFLGYSSNEIDIYGDTYLSLSSPDLIWMMERGFPQLPIFKKSIIISDDQGVNFRVLQEESEYLTTLPIIPSKGHFTRDIDPDDVPYIFADIYNKNEWYPSNNIEISEPYILREFRGTTIQFNPIQFNPALGQLKVYTRIVVEVFNDPSIDAVNTLERLSNEISKEFSSIYENHFINFPERSTEYDDLGETGRLLIIYHQDYSTQVTTYYDWKVASGFNTILAEYPTDIGSGSTAIKTYIQNLYDQPEGLLFIILIGESDEIPTLYGNSEGAPSDPCYVKLEGSDAYPDAYISRISPSSPDNCEYVLNKIMTYGGAGGDKNLWHYQGMGVASAEGTPPDYDRCDLLRDMLIDDMGFTEVDQIYDPGATSSQVTNALNSGRSIINYIGHGSGTSWSTTGFGVSHINNLSNGYMNPFIIDVACVNGDFTMGTCMEEAWIRAGDMNDPKGAIAAYGASTNASWVPPCDMQNHSIQLLTQYDKMTVGGVCFNGLMYAMDMWGGSNGEALKLMEQYNIFGDCSSYIIFSVIPDDVPPTEITDLQVQNIASDSYELTWTAPFDETRNGVVAYDVRSSLSPITSDNDFNNADPVPAGFPSSAGETEVLLVQDLNFDETRHYAIKSSDMFGNKSLLSNSCEATTLGEPDIEVTPLALSFPQVEVGEIFSDLITIANVSNELSTLDYTATFENNTFPMGVVRANLSAKNELQLLKSNPSKGEDTKGGGQTINGSGGPDTEGYVWRDSDDPNGPQYEWEDISTSGIEIIFPLGDQDDGWIPNVDLGFSFEYYGEVYNSINISTNGFVALSQIGNSERTNRPIPLDNEPNNIIAPFWDDLTGKLAGKFYFLSESEKFTVQYEGIQKYYSAANGGPSGSYTFQLVLYSNGKIKFYYNEMDGATDDATVGIENEDGTVGCQVAYNAAYPQNDEFATQLMIEPDWIYSDDLGDGRLYNGNSTALVLDFDATNLSEGNYNLDIVIESNDPDKSTIVIPVTMTVYDPVPVELTSFSGEFNNNKVLLRWETATETNNQGFEVERTSNSNTVTRTAHDQYAWTSIGFVDGHGTRSENSIYSYEDDLSGISNSKVSYRLKQIDFDGQYNYSESIELEILPLNYSLEQNYPNPFNPSTKIKFALPYTSKVKLTIYNSLGEIVATLFDGTKEGGYYEVNWIADNIPSGMYIYRMEAEAVENGNSFSDVRKMLLLK